MIANKAQLTVPAEPAYARSVRMLASTLAVTCNLSVDDVEDVRMAAEEGFVYACATAPATVTVDFELGASEVAMGFSLGDKDPDDESVELVEMLLAAVCDEFYESEDASTLHLVVRPEAGGGHDE